MAGIRKIAVGAVVLVAVSGAGAAVAATQLRSPQEESRAIVNDAAGQLGVTPAQLTNALKTAQKNRVDAAVKAGQLTKEQGDALKARINESSVPLLGPGGGGFRHGHHRGGGGHHHGLGAAAKYLGMTEAALKTALGEDKTLAQVAKDRGKSVDGLVNALVAAKGARIDQAVKDGKLTEAQADAFRSELKARTTEMVNRRPGQHSGKGFRGQGPGPDERPAVLAPAF
jgi:polyhydroxyalkanoate synthesis regulator phasin